MSFVFLLSCFDNSEQLKDKNRIFRTAGKYYVYYNGNTMEMPANLYITGDKKLEDYYAKGWLKNLNIEVMNKSELLNKNTGKVLPGLTTAGQVNENQENYNQTGDTASLALLALTGKKNQIFTLPLYIDYAQIIPGEYVLKLTLSSGQEDKIREVPIKIIKNRV